MSFSAEWLALREPADHAARDKNLLRQAALWAGQNPVILDLGCGTGATARAFSDVLPVNAQWRLVDSDSELLDRAAEEIGPTAKTYLLDLNEIEALPLEGVTLVTASALLDLVSEAWVNALVPKLDVPFYAALNYEGTMNWTPVGQLDEEIRIAFNTHQRTDKGFGPALGPDVAERSAEIFQNSGFEVDCADSPWQLGPGNGQLLFELIEGIAQAATDAGVKNATDWCCARQDNLSDTNCVIGHVDMLAMPTHIS